MEIELRSAFDKIHANDALKRKTADFLRDEINKRSRSYARPRLRLAVVCFLLLLFVTVSAVSYNIFFTPVAYVDMDVNPSIGLTLNRFNRVIDTHAYNEDGAAVLSGTRVRFKLYDEAAQALLDAIISNGYLSEGGLVSMTVQADYNAENSMLTGLNQVVITSLSKHHSRVRADIFTVTADVRSNAHEHHVTPAMYLAITELQAVDPTVTFEGCREHSIGEIRERTRGHHRNAPVFEPERNQAPEQGGGHHGGRHHR